MGMCKLLCDPLQPLNALGKNRFQVLYNPFTPVARHMTGYDSQRVPVQANVVSKFWCTADCGQPMARITGKLGQWPPGSTPRAERAAHG